MLVTNRLESSPSGGRELLCKLNYDALKDIYGDRLTVLQLARSPIRGVKRAARAFMGFIDGVEAETVDLALREIAARNVERIFVDGSNFGELIRVVKARFPKAKVHAFFHNVEAQFFWGSFRHNWTIHALAVAAANYLAERKAVRYSDEIICLSARDSRLLQSLYGRSATHVAAMAMRDTLPAAANRTAGRARQKFALFVGGVFYANRAGIAWFVDQVAPRIDIKICIVGRGFEAFRDELQRDGKVEVVGAVDDLAEWYAASHFVIAPIFDGSGMKTKVAEAMMFGKKIIGTPEAFSGYEEVVDRAGWACSTADEFVGAIRRAGDLPLKPFDPELRALYEAKYSYPAARARLEAIVGPLHA